MAIDCYVVYKPSQTSYLCNVHRFQKRNSIAIVHICGSRYMLFGTESKAQMNWFMRMLAARLFTQISTVL